MKKYGFSACADLRSVHLIVNNGDLANENDLNLKCDFDPTQTSNFQSVSNIKYKDIFYQVVEFIDKNNGKYGDNKRRYLQYPKLCLDANKPRCSDKEHCKRCYDKITSKNGILNLCLTIRRQIAVELLARGQLENCYSDLLYQTASKLCVNDRLFIADSKEYKLNKNWFSNVYSFLIWQQEVVHILLHNLVYLNEKSWDNNRKSQSKSQVLEKAKIGIVDADEIVYDEQKDIEYTTRGGGSMVHLQMKENDFLFQFDVLALLDSYLDELISYLVFCYCCFDCQLWSGIFYPFIECGIGTHQLKMLFDQSNEKYTSTQSGKKSHFCQIVEEFEDGNIEMQRQLCVHDMKAMSIFKRLLYDVYQPHGNEVNMDIANKNVTNAFNLANQVCTKLKETINNIKTQLVLRKITRRDNKNDLETENFNQESKEHWVIDDNDNVNDIIVAPTFIRLFVIRRIIDKYTKSHKHKKKDTKEIIKELSNAFKDNKKTQSLVISILTQLVKYGIKKYMSKYYNEEKKQANIIEDIFNKIILEKFSQEYNEMTKYGLNDENNDNYYQNSLFNSSDLMTKIYQYLQWGREFDEDLYECSLVCSHWLYHAWNANSVYYIDFSKLVIGNIYNNRKWTQIWQRLYNVKSIYIDFTVEYKGALATVKKLSKFTKVEKVNVKIYGDPVDKIISALISIMSRCKDRIKYCRIDINPFILAFEVPSPLRLPKAQYVDIGDLWFYRIWTNECTRLKLDRLKKITQDWCKFVIANCDCSNINSLILYGVTFDDDSINKEILKQLAVKFNNLKTFEIEIDHQIDDSVLLFWLLLKPILSKNKTKVKLKVARLKYDQYTLLSETMNEKDLKIDKLIIGRNDAFDGTIKLIQEGDNGGLNHLAIEDTVSESEGTKYLYELKCTSITVFELKDYNIDFVNALLEWKMIAQKQIFVIVDVYGHHNNYADSEILSLLKQLYQNIHQLFVQQIALDIKITLKTGTHSKIFSSYLSIYSSHFENLEFMLKYKYNKPKCNNNLCLPRDKPYTYFYIHDSQKEKYFVFGASNVQMK